MRIHETHQAINRAIMHRCVRVEQQQAAALRQPTGGIGYGRKAHVCLVFDQCRLRKAGADQPRCAITGGIVNDDDFVGRSCSAMQRGQTLGQHSAGVIRHDEDRYFWSMHK